MDILAFASRKGGSGKSTLAAHLAVHVHRPSRPCLLVDDDPQGSLTLWNELRENDALPIKTVKRGIANILKKTKPRRGMGVHRHAAERFGKRYRSHRGRYARYHSVPAGLV
jgi:cellulose biosynthesis protein BcsQ